MKTKFSIFSFLAILLCCRYLYADGMMYVSYYRDSTTSVEKISNSHTHTVLARFDPSKPENVTTFRHLSVGDSVGDRIVYTFQSFENGEKGYAASFFNTTLPVPNNAAKRGVMRRSRMRAAIVIPDCHFARYCDVASPCSIQYYAFGVNKGKVYIAFTEDRRKLNPNIAKGNISVTEIKLFS